MTPPRTLSPLRIALAYAAVGFLWISTTDALAHRLLPPGMLRLVESSKGIFFVGATALALYLLLMRRRIVEEDDFVALERDAAASQQLIRSLSEVRAAQTALGQSEIRMRNLIASSLDAIVTVTTDDLVLEWNQEAERLFGWSAAEAIGERLEELLVPLAQHEEYREALQKIGIGGVAAVPIRRFETIAVSRSGREFPIEITVATTEWGDQVVITGFMRDISDRRRAEQESQHVLAIINGAPFAMIALDGEGAILSWNPAAEKMYGWEADQVRGAHVSMLMPEDSQEPNVLIEKVRWSVPVDTEHAIHLRHDGKTIGVVWSLTPLPPIDGVTRAVLISVDLSERQQLETRLSDAEYLASLGRIAGTVAHEFNNVLMGIQPFVELLSRDSHDDRTARALVQMRMSIQRGRRVTEDILRFTRAAAAPGLHAINVSTWLSGIGLEIGELVTDGVSVRIDSNAPELDVVGDHAQLNQVLMNLALNARDAMPAGGELTISAVACAEPPPGMAPECVEITVRDSGVGMDSATAAHAFEPLFTTKKQGGTGLGLAVVQKIVRAHGGEVSLHSEIGEGTTFRIILPARHAVPADPSPEAFEKVWSARRILLVEDDIAVAVGIAELLRSYGMTVSVLHTGAGILESVASFIPDVVVLDVALPDRSGVEVYDEIAKQHPRLPVVFSTGHADEARLDGPLSRDNVAFLRKPYSVEALLEEIERMT
ncbi:MAG: PAS domain S-box protein [Thermoanaerobaculia bacterium]